MVARSAVPIISIAVLAACKGGEEAPSADPAAAAAPNVVSLSATEYAISAPDSIPAGWTTFRLANRGAEVHYGHIVGLDSGRTQKDLVAAYLEAIRTSGPRPAWVKRFGGPGGTAPGDSSNVTQNLAPGSYVWICPVEDDSGTPHFAKGEVKAFVVHAVAGGAAPGAPPVAGAAVRLADYTFTVEPPLAAGRQTIRVENVGAEAHDFGLLKLAPGRTIEEVRNWLNPERARRSDEKNNPPPPIETIGSVGGGIAAIGPGMSAFFETNLTPGEYVLFCMVTAPDGRSHIEHGMIRQLRVD